MLPIKPKRHRFPLEIINFAFWSYHRFNDSYRDIEERLAFRGIDISHVNHHPNGATQNHLKETTQNTKLYT